MSRLLTNVKFWLLAFSVTWLVVVTAIIVIDPVSAHGQ